MNANHSSATNGNPQSLSAAPQLIPSQPSSQAASGGEFDADAFMAAPPGNKGVIFGACIVGGGLFLCALGLFLNAGKGESSSPATAEAAPIASMMSDQQKMMHEAMQMAREAQRMNQERLELMRTAMERGDHE